MRLIDADALSEKLSKTTIFIKDGEVFQRMINDAPTVSAEADWIPCGEGLPDAADCPMDCMVTRKSKFVGNYVDMAVAEAEGTWTHEDWKAITINGKATCISTRDADIIAWMQLPPAYKEGDKE